jgi:phosphatidylglycerol:prolipoprotein diacylglycerol transferase
MYPVLFKIGSFELHSWGTAFALTFIIGILIAVKRASRFKLSSSIVLDFSLIVMISALAGSRLWYVVLHLDRFKDNWLDVINPLQGDHFGIAGMSMVGGIVFALVATFVYVVITKIDFFLLADSIAPSFLLGAGIQRLGGCFLNGCCFGRPTDSWMGIVFPPDSVAGSYFPGIPLWPTQLFASVLGFIGFFVILWLERWQKFTGYTFYLVFIYYSIDRFIVDQFRYYESEQILGQLGPLTFNVNHILLLGVFIYCIFFWLRGWRKQRSLQ